MLPVSRWLRFCLPVALVSRLVAPANAYVMPIQRPVGLSAVTLAADRVSPSSIQSDNSDDYVQVRDGKFKLAGKPFVIKGTNYFGSWLHHSTIDAGNGIEHVTVWALYHDWDSRNVDADFRFIHSQLNATAVRIGTPAESDFTDLVRYHDYQPWFNSDGTVAEQYKSELIQLADAARANGIRIQFCLLWNVGNEIAKDPGAFEFGGPMDRMYSNQVRSIASALRTHPGVIGYSIGNEVLVNWPINGRHPSWFEGKAAEFIQRRLEELRELAPRQLLTVDEVVHLEAKQWYTPGPEFSILSAFDIGKRSTHVRLADVVDYLGPHFYPVMLRPEDLADGFASKIGYAEQQLRTYMKAAKALKKPVVINEFGLKSPDTVTEEQYSAVRDQFFRAILTEGQRQGVQGLLAWDAVPEIVLITGHYSIKRSVLNAYSPIELDVDASDGIERRVLFYDPRFNLFEWRGKSALPEATPAAQAIAMAWAGVLQPNRKQPRVPNR